MARFDTRFQVRGWLDKLALVSVFATLLAGVLSKIPAIAAYVAGAWPVLVTLTIGSVLLVRGNAWKRGAVVIEDERVCLGKSTLPRSAIRSGYYVPGAGVVPSCVKLFDRKNRFLGAIEVADHVAAQTMLATLGLEKNAVRFEGFAARGTPAHWTVLLGILIAAVTIFLGPVFATAWLSPLAVAMVIATTALFLKVPIHVGADGVRIAARVGARFIPWSEVASIVPHERGALLELNGGETVMLPTSARQRMSEYDIAIKAALTARLEDALAAYQKSGTPNVVARVARSGRTTEAWLSSLFDREGDFRTAPIRSEDLWSVLETPGTSSTARAGAAAVLARDASQDDRTRLRIAADACVDPHVRVVIEKAATGSPESEIVEALDAVEDEKQRAELAR